MRQYPGVKKLKDGRFRIRVNARDPKTGREKELKRVIVAATPAEAAKARWDVREQFEAGSSQVRVRLADYVNSWLRGRLPTLKPSTVDKYVLVLGRHVLPALGDYFLDALDRRDIERWRDSQDGKPATVNSRLRVLRTVMAEATADLGLARNPASGVRAIKERFHEGAPNRLTAEQLSKVLAALQEHEPERYPLFLTLAFTAARVGEATALKWADIDFDAGTIHIRRARWKQHVDSTKTGTARTVPMPEPLATALKSHRRALIERQSKGLTAGWVFPSASGTPIYGSVLQKPLKHALAAAGVTERFTLHGFRRTFNNLMRQVTSGEVVRSITGHVTERMTEHYSHIESEEKRHAANDVLRLVYPSRARSGHEGGTSVAEQNEKTS